MYINDLKRFFLSCRLNKGFFFHLKTNFTLSNIAKRQFCELSISRFFLKGSYFIAVGKIKLLRDVAT